MSKQDIVEQYISSPFDADKYYDFLEEVFLVEDFLGDDLDTSQMIEDVIYHVSSLELGDKKVRCVALKVNSLDARAHQRDLFVRYAKDATTPIDAVVAAIIADDLASHRLSLVTFEPDEKSLKPIPSSYKRYSYRLGPDEVSKTTRQRLKEELLKYDMTLSHLKDVFSVEKVSKVFFEKYRALYTDIFNDDAVEAIYSEEAEREKFAKNLLGRIVFLYFLQKKGWLGVKENDEWGSGSKQFMRKLFKEYEGNDFYGDILYPLFFEALNEDRRETNDWFGTLNCRIPFLNGGLFDANNDVDKVSKYLMLDNNLFKNIFELFDAYNFTVIEDIPHDSEVAVDPEMLGRVFENLLDKNYRQGHGAYYTPRPIVHYMCQHSLVEYLANDFELEPIKSLVLDQVTDSDYIRNHANKIEAKLKQIKILDPAIGSGAFPMGLLHEVVSVLANLNKSLNTPSNLYEIKKEVIENCIHGVDIDESAVDIAKLRFWLSMVVDATTPEPLPNLYFKIMHGNSLVETVDGIDPIPANISDPKTKRKQANLLNPIQQAWDFDKVDAQDHIVVLTKKLHQFFKENNRNKKTKLLGEIFSIIRVILDQRIEELGNEITDIDRECALIETKKSRSTDDKIIKRYDAQLKRLRDDRYNKTITIQKIKDLQDAPIGRAIFMYKLWFGEILKEGGFDIVIANPPYIKEYTEKDAFDGARDLSCYQGKMDIWYLFACLGIELMKDETGILSYIATNNWISNAGASVFRNKVLDETRILEFIDFGDYKVFDSAGIQTMIMMLKKTTNNEEYFTEYSKVIDKNISKPELEKFLQQEKNAKFDYFKAKIIKKDLLDENITFLKQNIFSVLSILESNRNFELEDNEVAQGIVGAPDKAFIVKDEDYNDFTDDEKLYLKRFYTNAGKYLANITDKYIFYSTRNNITNMKNLPNLNNKLLPFMEQLKNRREVKSGQLQYFHLQWSRREIFFKKGCKIICATRTIAPSCTYTEDEFYGSRALNFIKTDRINLKYLTAILNSKIAHYWLKYKGKLTGDLLQVDKSQLLSIPIKQRENTKPFETIVDYIILLKQEDKEKYQFEIEFFERLVDIMVYELYFEKEIHEQGYGVLQLIEKEAIEDASLEQVLKLYRQWSDRNHKIAYNVAFIDSLEIIETIEANI
jgi:hypothetical protein